MAKLTIYNPDGIETVENTVLAWVPAIKDLAAATVAEMTAGTEFECATRSFETSTEVSEVEDKRLCSRTARKRPGQVSHSVSDLEIIIDDPQKPDAFIDKLEPGAKGFIVEFPNVKPGTEPKAGLRYYAWQVTVGKKAPGRITTEEGETFTMVVGVSVTDRTLAGTVKA